MSKVIFIGDTHLKGTSPVSRSDDYGQSILDKISWVADYATSVKASSLIFLGDLFDSVTVSISYLFKVLSVFKEIRGRGLSLYTIVGNHCIKFNRLDTLNQSPLGILVKAGCLSILKKLKVDNYTIYGWQYPEEIQKSQTPMSICCAHRYYELAFSDQSLSQKDLKELGYQYYILGHGHEPFDTVVGEGYSLYRPGSLSRCTSDKYNRFRIPRILVLDTVSSRFDYVDVKCLPGESIFLPEKEEKIFSMTELINYIGSSHLSSGIDVWEYVHTAQIPDNVRGLLISYMKEIGV